MTIVTEEDVRSRILVPFLQALGLGPNNIRTEVRFSIRLGRNVVHIGRSQGDTLSGRADILVVDDQGRNLFIVELKASSQKLTPEDRDQGISYARLLDDIAPFVLVTNGVDQELYDTITKAAIDVERFPDASAFWRSGRHPESVTDLNIRYDALRNFLGYSVDHVRMFSIAQQQGRMRTVRGIVGEVRKYLPDIYIPRRKIHAAFDRFIQSDAVTFALVGESGVGKTNEMCALAERAAQHSISLFFLASEIYGSFADGLADEFNWHFSEHLHLSQIVERLEGVGRSTKQPVIIFIDALDEASVPRFELEISELVRRLSKFSGRVKLVVSAKREDWSRFAYVRGNPSPLTLSLYSEQSASLNEPDRDRASRPPDPQPITIDRMYPDEAADAEMAYVEKFHLAGRPRGALSELCRLPLILRLVGEVFGGSGLPLPSDLGQPELLRMFLEHQLGRMTDPVRSRLELVAVGSALARRRPPPGAFTEIADLQSVAESDVREMASLPATEPIARELVLFNLLERTLDSERRPSLRFYYGRMRDYVIARWVLDLDTKLPAELAASLGEILTHPLLLSAVVWHVQYGPLEHREVYHTLVRGRAALLLSHYRTKIDELAPGIRPNIEPYTVGEVGLAYWLDNDLRVAAWGFYPAERAGGNILTEFSAKERDHMYRDAISLGVSIGGGKDFMNTDPATIASDYAWRQIAEAIKDGALVEAGIPVVENETVLTLAHDCREKLGYPRHYDDVDWTAGLLPFDCADALRRIYIYSGSEYYRDNWVEVEKTKPDSAYIRLYGGGYGITYPTELAETSREWATRQVDAGTTFPVCGTWEIHRLSAALITVLARQTVLTEHILPRPDQPERARAAHDPAYSDAALSAHFTAVFVLALEVYERLAYINFGQFRFSLPLLSQFPLRIQIEYRRSENTIDAGQDWGHLTYVIYRGSGDSHRVDVSTDPREFTVLKQMANGSFENSDDPPIRGPVFSDPHKYFVANGPRFGGERAGGESRHAVVRSLAYHFLRDDFRKINPLDDFGYGPLRTREASARVNR